MGETDTEKAAALSFDDETLDEIVRTAEAGVGDAIAVYEQAEARYFAAVSEAPTSQETTAYATHT